LPFGGTATAVAAPPPPEPTCAALFADGLANPETGVLPLGTGYAAVSRVTSGQDEIINTVDNTDAYRRAGAGPRLGWRFSASLKTAATPAYNEVFNGDPDIQVPNSYGYLRVYWSNGRTIDPHASGSPGIPNGVEYKLPTVEISERTSLLFGSLNQLHIAKGTGMGVPGSGTSIANLAPSAIIQTLASVPGVVVNGNVDVITGSLALRYKSTYFPTRDSWFAIYPDSVADLTTQPDFVAAANAELDALSGTFVPVVAGDPDDSCTKVGVMMVACTYQPSLVPPALEAVCDELI
jgi:hypothetical protein